MYESDAVLEPLTPSAVEVYVPMSVAPEPNALVALWKRLVKPAPVEADPLFEIVLERVTAVPTVAVVGDVGLAVRSVSATEVTKSVLEHACVTAWEPEVTVTLADLVPAET